MAAIARSTPQKVASATDGPWRFEGARSAQIAAMVLLAGGAGLSRLHRAIRRSPLDLPIAAGMTLFQLWRHQVDQLAGALGGIGLRGRLMVGGASMAPAPTDEGGPSIWSVETDPVELRGTGGLLRDLAVGYNDNDYLVVATATQLPLHPIGRFVADSAQPGVDVAVLEDLTGSPTSVFVIACRTLHEVPAVGFVDLKEQALPAIAAKHSVRVTSLPGPLAVPVRTAANYLSAVRAHSRRLSGQHDTHSAFAERWRSDFAIVEPGARVHHSARLHNAVVLAGAEVEACSMVANSLVCPGGRVLRGNRVVNRLITAEGCSSISDS